MVQIIFPRTHYSRETKLKEEIDYSAVRKTLLASRTSKRALNAREKASNALCIKFLKKVVEKQLQETFKLNLSNDEEIAPMLDCTPRQVQRAREKLSAGGVIYVPAWAKQKKRGDYPIWFLNFEFLKPNEAQGKQPAPMRNSSFVPLYDAILTQSKRTVMDQLEDIESEFPGEMVSPTIREYMGLVWTQFAADLLAAGLTREDLKK